MMRLELACDVWVVEGATGVRLLSVVLLDVVATTYALVEPPLLDGF